jgi:hypothetical protein
MRVAASGALLAQDGVKERFAILAQAKMVLLRGAACSVSVTKANQAIQRKVILPQFHLLSPVEDERNNRFNCCCAAT